jgi:DNA-binding MarR family transcriptional regulator
MTDFVRAARTISSECACMSVRRASRVLSRVYDEALKPVGVQASQLSVLVAVARFGEPGAALGELAGALVMDRTTLTRNLRPLEKGGFVRVARSPHDARSRIVLLTRAGERAIEAALPLWERAQQRVHKALGARNVTALRAELGKLVAGV